MIIQADPKLPRNPPQGYMTELVNRLYRLFELLARHINVLQDGVVVNADYTAATLDRVVAVIGRPMAVKAVHGRVTVAGTDAGAVSAIVRKVPSGTAITGGTPVHQGTFNLKGTVNTVQEMTIAAAPADVALLRGDSIAVDFSGVLTAAVGTISILMEPT